jgi:hypothetical protein
VARPPTCVNLLWVAFKINGDGSMKRRLVLIRNHESSVITRKAAEELQQIWSTSQRGRELLGCCYLPGAVEGNFWKRVKDRVH